MDRDEIEYRRYDEKRRILIMQIIFVSCEVLKFGYDNLGLVGEKMRNDVKRVTESQPQWDYLERV